MAPRVIATMSAVVKIEARIFFMRASLRRPTVTSSATGAGRRITQPKRNQNGEVRLPANPDSAQARPIVGNDDGVAGVGGIVFDAGRLPGNQALETDLPFQAGDVLGSMVRHAGNGVAVRNQMPRPRIRNWS